MSHRGVNHVGGGFATRVGDYTDAIATHRAHERRRDEIKGDLEGAASLRPNWYSRLFKNRKSKITPDSSQISTALEQGMPTLSAVDI